MTLVEPAGNLSLGCPVGSRAPLHSRGDEEPYGLSRELIVAPRRSYPGRLR